MRFLQFEGIVSGLSQRPRPYPSSDDIEEDPEEFLDPWTRKVMVEPVRSRKCGHLYSSETVTRHLERSSKTSRRLQCPVPGCDNDDVRHSDLGLDVSVRQRIIKLRGMGLYSSQQSLSFPKQILTSPQ